MMSDKKKMGRRKEDKPLPWYETYTCKDHKVFACQDKNCLAQGRFQNVNLKR